MSAGPEIDVDIEKAERIWAEYEKMHDLTGKQHLAVGIDPTSGDVFLGESAMEIHEKLMQEGRFRPLFFRRVGSPYYTGKGRGRCLET